VAVKDEEMRLIGELLSNLYGGLKLLRWLNQGKSEKEAGNIFLQTNKRVLGSIDQVTDAYQANPAMALSVDLQLHPNFSYANLVKW